METGYCIEGIYYGKLMDYDLYRAHDSVSFSTETLIIQFMIMGYSHGTVRMSFDL